MLTDADLNGSDHTLTDLTDCRVFLFGRIGALRLVRLRDCTVCAGPVSGSTFLDDVQGATLFLISRQIRIHSTKNTDFYLQVNL